MAPTLWQYPRCGTCRKALKWLDAHGVAVTAVDLVATPPDRAALEDLWRRSALPVRRLFNTSGQSYRAGGWKDRLGAVSDAEALDALAADGKLIKRPLLDTGGRVLVGFDADAWAEALRA